MVTMKSLIPALVLDLTAVTGQVAMGLGGIGPTDLHLPADFLTGFLVVFDGHDRIIS